MKAEDKRMTREEYIAWQLAIVAKYTKKPALKALPTAEQKAEKNWQEKRNRWPQCCRMLEGLKLPLLRR